MEGIEPQVSTDNTDSLVELPLSSPGAQQEFLRPAGKHNGCKGKADAAEHDDGKNQDKAKCKLATGSLRQRTLSVILPQRFL